MDRKRRSHRVNNVSTELKPKSMLSSIWTCPRNAARQFSVLLTGDTARSDSPGNAHRAAGKRAAPREPRSPRLLPALPSSAPRRSAEPLSTDQETLPSVQGDEGLVDASVGSLQQQLGVALVGVDQVGE